MPKPITFSQFYEANGTALAAWVAVEDAFCNLFTRLVICSVTGRGVLVSADDGLWVVPSIFHSSTNLRSRIDRIFRHLIKDEYLITEWEAITEKSRTLYGRRNVIAHGHVWGNSDGAHCVAYPLHADRRKRMSYQQTCGASLSFRKYQERIERLAIASHDILAARG
jgi:hypothetical protein